MAKLKLKNVYMKDETGKKYTTYDEVVVEYQDNGDDEKFARILANYSEGKVDLLDTYNALAEDMIISPESFKDWKNFGKNGFAIANKLAGFFLKYGNKDLADANSKLEFEEIDGE